MFPDVPEVNGRKLVPQLSIGCFLFTGLGLLATYLVANAMTKYIKHDPRILNQAIERSK